MRAWPPFQLLLALVLTGVAAVALYTVLGGRDSPALSVVEASGSDEGNPSRSFSLQLESTVPIDLSAVRLGSETLAGSSINDRTSVYKGNLGADEPLRIRGEVSADHLPFALLIELETANRPRREELRWIDASPFQVVLYKWFKEERP